MIDTMFEDPDGGKEIPKGSDQGAGGGTNTRPKPKDGTGKQDPNGNPVFVKEELRNMIYRFICVDRINRKYAVVFKSDYSINDVLLVIKPLDDSNGVLDLEFSNVLVNGNPVSLIDKYTIKLDLVLDERYKIEFNVDQDEYFTCGVKAYANKE